MAGSGYSFSKHVPRDIAENLRWRARVHREVLNDRSFADVIWNACAKDPVFYLSGFCYTYNPRPKSGATRNPFPKLPFILFPFQEDAILEMIRAIREGHDLFVSKSREMGASWMCLAAIEWMWHFEESRMSFLLGSRNEKYVDDPGNPKSLFWKIDYILDNQPMWLLPRGYSRSNKECRRSLHFTNPSSGSAIDGESTTDEFARGDRRTAIVLDEFAAVKEGHRILNATRDATDCRVFNSTPHGCANAYYDVSKLDIEKLRLHWSVHPHKNRGLYTTDKDGRLKILIEDGYPHGYVPILDGKTRSPWYDKECKRATSAAEIAQELDIDFLGSGFQYFNAGAITDLVTLTATPPMFTGELKITSDTATPAEFEEKENGHLELWMGYKDVPIFDKYVVTADISAGTGASNSALCVYNTRTCEKVAQYVSPFIRPEAFATFAVAMCKWMNDAYLIWENNGVGRQFGAKVMDLHYGNVYYDKNESAKVAKISKNPGWSSTKEKKLVLLGEYREALESKKLINRSKDALEECLHYVYADDGGVEHDESKIDDPSGAKANHGDRVIADALAWRGMTERPSREEEKKKDPPYGSLAWRMRRKERDKKNGQRELTWKDGWRP